MAYIPPHKRHSLEKGRPSPTAESFGPRFQRNLSLTKINWSGKIVYADRAISRWFAVGLSDNGQFPSHVHLNPTSSKPSESLVRPSREKPLILMNSHVTNGWLPSNLELLLYMF